ncbi:MAG: asparaginase [Rhodospirillales bacterium]|nr:asparaginase [Rhodospirillales bacterium]
MPDEASPVLVEVTRGRLIESRHRGSAVVADAEGRVVAAWGDAGLPVYPRSSIKPLQALALIETGAAKRFAVSSEEIALACASHDADTEHVSRIAAWLGRMGLSETDLECGAHAPTAPAAAEALIREGRAPSAIHNNCSGKHAGMLASALHLGEPTKAYLAPDHPVQRRLKRLLAEMSGADLAEAPTGVDGCGIPVYAMPLKGLARAMAGLAGPDTLASPRAEAARSVIAAMTRHPRLVSGQGRFDTEAMTVGAGLFAVKGGAEGVHAAAIPGLGLGIAVKIEDGAGRASAIVMAALLTRFASASLPAWREVPVRNVAGHEVGVLRAGPALSV